MAIHVFVLSCQQELIINNAEHYRRLSDKSFLNSLMKKDLQIL
jgi:hypothetical protein